jgi:Bacteriophage HK97-gp10, putative tail-component
MPQGAFSLDIRKFAEKAGAKADFVVKKTIFDLFSEIVMRTPVDTGRLRANWQIGVNQAPGAAYDWVDKDGSATLQIAQQMLDTAKGIGDTYYIVNNLVYAIPIEYGHSKQAPAGMVRVSVASFKNFVDINS